jgi:drug/metabolite transporter (DMT)-like permease
MKTTVASNGLAFLALASAMSLVGIYVALSKPLVAAFPVMLLAWLRFGIGAIYMLPWLSSKPSDDRIDAPTHRLLFLESLAGNFLFSICMLYGVAFAGASAAAIVFAGIPAAVAVLGRLFLKETITPRTGLSILLGISGTALLAYSKLAPSGSIDNSDSTSHALLGVGLLIAAVVCEATYVVIGKRLSQTISAKRISAIVNLWGLALMTPFGLWLAFNFEFQNVTSNLWALLVFYALAASAWSVQLWMTGIKTIPAAKAGVMTVMLPISATLTGVLFLGERLNAMQLIALVLALLGAILATTGSATKQTKH